MHEPAIQATTSLPMADAEAKLRGALQAEGFGVLTEVDVQAVLKEKLDVDVESYRILGVCNPKIAHRALGIWKGIGLIAPCHVALYDAGDHRVVIAFDPTDLPEVRDNAELFDILKEARDIIERAVRTLDGS